MGTHNIIIWNDPAQDYIELDSQYFTELYTKTAEAIEGSIEQISPFKYDISNATRIKVTFDQVGSGFIAAGLGPTARYYVAYKTFNVSARLNTNWTEIQQYIKLDESAQSNYVIQTAPDVYNYTLLEGNAFKMVDSIETNQHEMVPYGMIYIPYDSLQWKGFKIEPIEILDDGGIVLNGIKFMLHVIYGVPALIDEEGGLVMPLIDSGISWLPYMFVSEETIALINIDKNLFYKVKGELTWQTL